MRKITGISLILVLSLFIACASKEAPKEGTKSINPVVEKPRMVGWEIEWQKTLEAARKEKFVNVLAFAESGVRTSVGKAFKEKYGIDIGWTAGRSAELTEKVLRERRAGLYLADISLSGPVSFVNVLKPAGIVEPLEPEFILPDVKDKSLWFDGKLPLYDREGKIAYTILSPSTMIHFNGELITKEQVQSYKDLLNPKWKGKIAWDDPTGTGPGYKAFGVLGELIFDYDFVRELAKQEPAFTRDRLLLVEWIAKRKYAIAIGADKSLTLRYREAGVPLVDHIPREGTYLTTGGGTMVLYKDAPHPNARRVFVNWILSREGQTTWSKSYGYQSAREDVSTGHLESDEVRKRGEKYYITDEDWDLGRDGRIAVAKEIFGHLMR